MSNNNVLDAALSIIVACHAKQKNAPEHHVQERFLLPINGVSPLFYPT